MKIKIQTIVSAYRNDMIYRANISMYASLAINIAYAIFEAISGYVLHSAWMETLAFYYIVLSSIRFFILCRKKQIDIYKQWKTYRTCGIFILLLTIALAGLHILNIKQYHTIQYPGYVIYAVAVYTFYITVIAVRNMILYRKMNTPIWHASKTINLAVALISMYTLQSSMISTFGENDEFFRITMSNSVGIGVLAVIVSTSAYMVATANKKLQSF